VINIVRQIIVGAAILVLTAQSVSASSADVAAIHREEMTQRGRSLLIREYPEVFNNFLRNDGFGEPSSLKISNRMRDRSPELVALSEPDMPLQEATVYLAAASMGRAELENMEKWE
jgi:hypothetical protein